MPFSAINTVEQDLKQLNEKHTLELQLEHAMGVYQEALEAQRLNQSELAEEKYRKLFLYDVIQPKRQSYRDYEQSSGNSQTKMSAKSLQLGPAIRLRAMALKNYALLLLSQPDVSVEIVNGALAYLAESLDLVGSDDRENLVLPSLVQIYWALGFRRLARLALENIIQNNDGSALDPLEIWSTIDSDDRIRSLLGPRTIANLETLDYMKYVNYEELYRKGDKKEYSLPRLLRNFENIAELGDEQPSLEEKLQSESVASVTLNGKTWQSLLNSLTDVLNSACKRSKRKSFKDTYSWARRGLWNVVFSDVVSAVQRQDNEIGPSTPLQKDDDLEEAVSAKLTPRLETNESSREETPARTEEDNCPQEEEDAREEVAKKEETEEPEGESKYQSLKRTAPQSVKASPVKRRRADRVKRSSLALPADFGVLDTNFSNQFNAYLAASEDKVQKHLPTFFSPAALFLNQNQETPAELAGATELRDLLVNWDSRESSQFLNDATGGRNGSVIMAQKSGGSKRDDEEDEEEDEEDEIHIQEQKRLESNEVERYLTIHNGMHIQQIRWSLARLLLSKVVAGGKNTAYGDMVYKFIEEVDAMLWERCDFLKPEQITAIYGLYVNAWLNKKDQDTYLKQSRWQIMSAMNPSVLHYWISAFAEQENEESSPESSVINFEAIAPLMKEAGNQPTLLSHVTKIPALTYDNAQIQISKFKAAAAFERVLTPVDKRNGNCTSTNEDDVKLLQAMLMPESYPKPESTPDAEFEAIQRFLGYSQPQFKMRLWYTLLEKYEASGSASDSLIGLTQIFSEGMLSYSKGEPLLHTLNVAHDVGKRLVPLLERSPQLLDSINHETAKELLKHIVMLLQMLHLFMLYDDAVNSNLMQKPVTPSWIKVLPKFRELVVFWWCLFYRFWLRCVPDTIKQSAETRNDLLSIIHERLGNLGYCSAAGGGLLTLHCSEIAHLNWDGSALDLTQCLKCKFGLSLSLNGDVANHHTVPVPLSTSEAIKLTPLVTKMILNHRSFNQMVMRMDTRAVIDEFSKAYKVSNQFQLDARLQKIRGYFNRDYSPSLLREAWNGKGDCLLSFPDSDDAYGIWVLQGIVNINQYRMRRRQAYAATSIRTETLHTAIDFLQQDLAARPNRFESWVGLAQIYLYMCEDSMTFGYELGIPNEPASYCRQALLAASRAIALKVCQRAKQKNNTNVSGNALLNIDTKDVDKPLQSELSESLSTEIVPMFGYLLYLSVIPPLLKSPFGASSRPDRPILVEFPDADHNRVAVQKPNEVDENLAMLISWKCLKNSSDNRADWIHLLYRVQLAKRLNFEPAKILALARRAHEESPSGNNEAYFNLIHIVWQLRNEKKITAEQVIIELSVLKNPKNAISETNGDAHTRAQHTIENKLRWQIEKDKWAHRPRLLLAKIYDLDYSDPVRAEKELHELFSLKSPTKPLVIWSGESDTPGQHSVLMSKYVRYMTDVMMKNKDSAGLLLMTRRFRKTGYEMWNHTSTFEYVYVKTCELSRNMLPIDMNQQKFSEVLMSELAGQGSEFFERVTNAMSDAETAGFSDTDKWVQALFYVIDLRKNQLGPATIAMADDVVIIVFITMIRRFVRDNPDRVKPDEPNAAEGITSNDKAELNKPATKSIPSKPEGKNNEVVGKPKKQKAEATQKKANAARKRIIRKDVINAAQNFLRPFQQKLSKIDELSMPTDMPK